MGRKPNTNTTTTFRCVCCGKRKEISSLFYDTKSELYNVDKIPFCKDCLNDIYIKYIEKYKRDGFVNYIHKTIERMCMITDLYYNENILSNLLSKEERSPEDPVLFSIYYRSTRIRQYINKTYDDTIKDRFNTLVDKNNTNTNTNVDSNSFYLDEDVSNSDIIKKATKFFGTGFSKDDYIFLQEQYDDWTTRHECKTKVQEEIFKQICFTQLDLLKATRAKQDTKDLMTVFQKLLDSAKLQPKQNTKETVSDAQTLGTLIDKWENTRPIPEIDENLRDVDKIGLYVDIFFKGHLAKMMGIKNGFSNLYEKFIKKYTVEKPEYSDDDNSEVLFDAIFGNKDI